MGKKRCRPTYSSKGERRNVSKSTVRLAREGRSAAEKELAKLKAWKKGQNPWITFYDPKRPSNIRWYRVRANECWGNPKNTSSGIYSKKEEE